MFVSPKAKQFILIKRRSQILEQMIKELVMEANRLDVSESELNRMIQLARQNKEEKQL